MRLSNLIGIGIALVCPACFCLALAFTPSPETPVVSSGVTESVDGQNETSTFTFTVDPKDSTVKDVHIVPAKGKALVKPKTNAQGDPMVSMPQNWIFRQSSSGHSYNFYSGRNGSAIPPKGASFSVTVPTKDGVPPPISVDTFTFTSDGDYNVKTGYISETTKNADGHDLKEPVTKLTVWLGPGSRNEAGGFLLINSRTDLHGLAFQAYGSRSLAATQGEDSLGIGLNMSDVPPPSWVTSTERMRGAFHVIDGEGFAQTRINLGDDTEMEGKHLYIVVSLDLDNDGVPDVFNSPPLDIVLFQE